MNREIKFKAVAINTSQWLESTTIAKGVIKRKANNYYFEVDENVWVGVVPESLGQFTGLKDKNGIEIYEGDIIKHDNDIKCTIIFEGGGFCYKYMDDEIIRHMGVSAQWCEVIGNIYQNPDLL